MKTFTGWARFAVAVLMIAGSGSSLSAQEPNEVDTDEAVRLETKARDLLAETNKWDRAASLFRRAAEYREAGDPEAVRDLLQAARLSYYDGDRRPAVRDLENAGEPALNRGDVIVAANAFADAAWVAGNYGQGDRATALLNRARLLSNSPLIEDADRSHLQTRWGVAGSQ